ncbi:GAG protein [Colletotrichum tofieldiae]|nr:GAG protein [Colletotrichum tofieldiae]
MTHENKKLHLKSTKDWILWFNQLQSKAKSYGLWQAIDPSVSAIRTRNTIASLIKAPERPLPSDHPRRVATRGASSAASQSATPGRDDYSVLLSANDTHTPRAEGIQDLSPENLALYKEQRTDYAKSLQAYKSRMKRYRELQDWFRSTVNVKLLRHYCTADKNLNEWVKSLQKRVGTRPHKRRNKAQAAYEAVLKAPTRKHLNTQKDVKN